MSAQNFATYMTNFAGAQNTNRRAANYYSLRNDPPNPGQNCFAYAVGKLTRINAQTQAQLTEECKSASFSQILL